MNEIEMKSSEMVNAEAETILRAWLPDDLPRLSEIYLSSRRENFRWLDEQVLGRADFLQDTRDERVLVAQQGADIVGFSSVWVADNFIHHLYVAPGSTGRGVGARLLVATLDGLGRPASLKCLTRNERALAFYAHHGFHVMARDRGEEGEYFEMVLDA